MRIGNIRLWRSLPNGKATLLDNVLGTRIRGEHNSTTALLLEHQLGMPGTAAENLGVYQDHERYVVIGSITGWSQREMEPLSEFRLPRHFVQVIRPSVKDTRTYPCKTWEAACATLQNCIGVGETCIRRNQSASYYEEWILELLADLTGQPQATPNGKCMVMPSGIGQCTPTVPDV